MPASRHHFERSAWGETCLTVHFWPPHLLFCFDLLQGARMGLAAVRKSFEFGKIGSEIGGDMGKLISWSGSSYQMKSPDGKRKRNLATWPGDHTHHVLNLRTAEAGDKRH